MKALVVFLLVAIVAVAAYQGVMTHSAEAEIREADAEWVQAVGSKSLERTLSFYAPDAVTAGSAMFPANGKPDFRAAWTTLFADPNFALTGKLEKVVVTKNGSIAYSSGTWSDGKKHGPYLAVWQKQATGQWKVIIDSAWVTP